jgi:hypothetical protein
MIQVFVNGILQVPGIDYALGETVLSFSVPPDVGDQIDIMNAGKCLSRFIGDGHRYLYQGLDLTEKLDHVTLGLFYDAHAHKHVPAVQDALERLKVVIELAKE